MSSDLLAPDLLVVGFRVLAKAQTKSEDAKKN